MNWMQHVKEALAHLNPQEVREQAERPLRIGLYAPSETAYQRMETFLIPPEVSPAKRVELRSVLDRAYLVSTPKTHDLDIYNQDLRKPENAFSFNPHDPERMVREILKQRPELALSLARHIYPFRDPVIQAAVKKIAKENALFSLATALPDIVPLLSLPWAVGEFATDTAFITANQMRMAFMIAAASDRPVGYREQKAEVASIIAGAFGWRAIARELIGKIPLGGGLIPKAAVAYAGTKVAGMSLERYYRVGYGYTRAERKVEYADAIEKGKSFATTLLEGLRQSHLVRGA